jgi:hypothetical protein
MADVAEAESSSLQQCQSPKCLSRKGRFIRECKELLIFTKVLNMSMECGAYSNSSMKGFNGSK